MKKVASDFAYLILNLIVTNDNLMAILRQQLPSQIDRGNFYGYKYTTTFLFVFVDYILSA